MTKTTDDAHNRAESPAIDLPRARRLNAVFTTADHVAVNRAVTLYLALRGDANASDPDDTGEALAAICARWHRERLAELAEGKP